MGHIKVELRALLSSKVCKNPCAHKHLGVKRLSGRMDMHAYSHFLIFLWEAQVKETSFLSHYFVPAQAQNNKVNICTILLWVKNTTLNITELELTIIHDDTEQ